MGAVESLLGLDARPPLDWPTDGLFPPRLSPSSVALGASCPERWRRKYVHREREPWGGAALVGVAVHKAVEENMRQKVESHQDLPLKDALELAAVSFDDKVVEAENDGIEWGDTKPGEAKDLSVSLSRAYHVEAAPSVQPVEVERWVGATLPGIPEITGRIDIVADRGVVDVKTTGRKMTSPRGDWRLKAMVYQLMTGLPFEWHVVTKTKVPAVYTPTSEPGLVLPASEAVRRVAYGRVATVAEQLVGMLERYGPDDPWPTNAPEHDWACNYCGMRRNCAWWAS